MKYLIHKVTSTKQGHVISPGDTEIIKPKNKAEFFATISELRKSGARVGTVEVRCHITKEVPNE